MIGISCTHFCSKSVSEWIGPIAESFRHWEIFSEADHAITRDTDALADLLSTYDMSYSVHSPICDMNIGSMTDRLRQASINELVETAKAANRIGIEVMTVHPGLDSMSVHGVTERSVERAKAAMRDIEHASHEYGVMMAIENMPEMPFFLGRTAADLAHIVDGTDLGICFDIGHANTCGQIDAMIDTFGDRIVNIHIHDNHGERDEHLTIGDGSIDFEPIIRRLSGYRGNYIIESRDFDSAVTSQSRLEPLLS